MAKVITYTIDVTCVSTNAELWSAVGNAVGHTMGHVYALSWFLDDLPGPASFSVVGFADLANGLPIPAKLLRLTLQQYAERHKDDGASVRFV